MRTSNSLLKECCLAVALLMAFPLMGNASPSSKAFRARANLNKVQKLSLQLTHSDTISLSSRAAIYALSIDATINQPRESSFVRIVLEDSEGHNYLIAESDRFRNDTTTIQLTDYCEETAQLSGVTPTCLKCYLAGDATLALTGIHTADEVPMRTMSTNDTETEKTIKEVQVQDIVERINEYNIKHRKLWEAGQTPAAMMSLEERTLHGEALDEADPYLSNLIYYVGGLYEIGEIGETETMHSSSESLYVDSFDWRNRHGQDWTTIPKNQWSSSWCSEFAVAGTIEAYTNLYYNKHLDLDLSEPYLAYKCNQKFNKGGNNFTVFAKAKTYGVIDESSYPFVDDSTQQWPSVEPTCSERIKINNYSFIPSSSSNDILKHTIINKGPCATSFNVKRIVNGKVQYPGHAFGVVGYGKVTPNIMYFFLKEDGWQDTLLQSDDYRIGMDYWICKDSYYNHPGPSIRKRYQGHEGYMYIICDANKRLGNFVYPTGALQSMNYTDDDIVVEDRDGDGYFNWGIGPRPNDRLPAWAEEEEDGDDSNKNRGVMDTYGNIATINYPTSTIVIDHDMTDSEFIATYNNGSRFIRQNIRINAGVTFKIEGALAFYSGKFIYMNSNSILNIDGGILVDARLVKSSAGGKVRITSNGRISGHKRTEFQLPTGILLDLDNGSID